MYPYVAIFVFFSIFALIEIACKDKYKSIIDLFFLYSTLLLVFFAGARAVGVGSDDENYYNMFLSVPNFSEWIYGEFSYSFEKIWMEPGYVFFGSIFRSISSEPVALFFPVAFLSVTIACYYYYKLSPYYFMSLLLFFSHNFLYRDINQIRSAITCAIGLALISFIYKRKKIHTFILILLASLFHMVGLVYFVTFVFSRISQYRKLHFYGLLISVFLSISGFLHFLISNINFLGVISTKISSYSTTEKYVNSVGLLDITNIKNMVIFLLLYSFWDVLSSKYDKFRICFTFFAFGVFWRIAFSEFGVLSARVATIFTITEVILIPMLISIFKQKLTPALITVFYAFLMLYINLFIKDGRHPYYISLGIF
ncbi:EpsG family protein [Vibrio metoecus]|uniref:EpsG family protein n=1 Tax=Vibrio metoecus TaxID=1481663 RepID=UPI0006D7BE91|nr:EpsG family protein [Vibrio metoecus]KQA98433.1 hypothetical protein XV91_13165 [Vibrio metoecus]PAR54872.1 EpsG family protein [Vibrio metoecus]PAR67524.1 EpsG family protein [Vibrio metoecus]